MTCRKERNLEKGVSNGLCWDRMGLQRKQWLGMRPGARQQQSESVVMKGLS